MSRIIMHRGDIGLELVKQERSAHQLSSSDLIGCGSSSSAIVDGKSLSFKKEIFELNELYELPNLSSMLESDD